MYLRQLDKKILDFLLSHLNINSIQNKFKELRQIVMESKVQIMAVSETKIDASYTDSQFHIPGYHLHHPDKKKGSGRVLMLGTSKMESVRVKIDIRYKKIEIIALQFVLKTKNSYYSPSTGHQRKLPHTTSYFWKRN